jgi:hypothetical protein
LIFGLRAACHKGAGSVRLHHWRQRSLSAARRWLVHPDPHVGTCLSFSLVDLRRPRMIGPSRRKGCISCGLACGDSTGDAEHPDAGVADAGRYGRWAAPMRAAQTRVPNAAAPGNAGGRRSNGRCGREHQGGNERRYGRRRRDVRPVATAHELRCGASPCARAVLANIRPFDWRRPCC